MECKKCAGKIPDGAVFCQHCGAKQTAPSRQKRRRGNGQGCAIKRGSTWSAVWTEASYVDGDRFVQKQRWKGGFRTKADALAFAAGPHAAEQEKSPTLAQYWNTWSTHGMTELSANKQGSYKNAWGRLSAVSHTPMSELDVSRLQACIDSQVSTYYPARDMKTVLSHLYTLAMADGVASSNLSQLLKLPKLQETETEPFRTDELEAMWAAWSQGGAAAGDRVLASILLMCYTGMMPGELLGLKVEHVDLAKREIIGAGLKTKKRQSTPMVWPSVLDPVVTQLVEGSTSRIGKVLAIQKDRYYKEYHAVLRRIGVRDLDPYSCRHTTGTALALAGVAPSVIQETMRHSKFQTTTRYIHPDTASTHTAIDAMAAAYGPAETGDDTSGN